MNNKQTQVFNTPCDKDTNTIQNCSITAQHKGELLKSIKTTIIIQAVFCGSDTQVQYICLDSNLEFNKDLE